MGDLIMQDKGWTGPYCGVSHLVRDNIQYTVQDNGSFTTGLIFSWRTCKTLERDLYFRGENHLEEARQYMESRTQLYR